METWTAMFLIQMHKPLWVETPNRHPLDGKQFN